MKRVFKYVILSILIAQYFVGSIGFTVHHCCCKKLYHTSACLTDVFFPYEVHDCLKQLENLHADNHVKVSPYRHCGSYTYSMDHMKYNYQKKVPAPPLYLILMQDIALLNCLPQIIETADQQKYSKYYYSKEYKRRWCEPERLCIFTI
ncbi:MAG: hypothetical protein RR312_05955 [Bacteroidales bacterium]